ncbi:MAG: late competence development ComFB family protein [Treponema sp.]|nr:late competence development ComFB family protein [Treponema sp.]
MAFADKYDLSQLKNEAEEIVLKELERQLAVYDEEEGDEQEEFCRCNDCVLDMAAMAFNSVKPIYRFSLLGSLYAAQAMNDQEYAESVQQAVAQAIAKVKANPSHD